MATLINTTQAAALLGVKRRRVLQLIKANRLPATRLGREWMIKTADLALVQDRQPGRPKRKV